MLRKILSLTLSISLLFQYSGFAQSINLADYLSQGHNVVALDRFRPLALRYFSYEPSADNFKILLDKGDQKNLSDTKIKDEADKLLTYFKIGLTLPNEKFWVNLRPDAEDQIIDPELEKTDLGKALLEADLQLKKDTSSLTSPQSKEGKVYWDKLYKKAGELFGTENITIPTITRPWIVPGEIILRESNDKSSQGAYIYKANLKVMLEEDYLRGGSRTAPTSAFSDPRLKELNQYSTQLIRELILPRLTQKVNSSKDYANLRQVYFSLILARWFKETFNSQSTNNNSQNNDSYIKLIDSNNLTNLTSKQAWDKITYFNAYQKSFKEGEYNLSEKVYTPTGQSIRRYTSGGGNFIDLNPGVFKTAGSAINIKDGKTLLNIEAGQLNIQKTAASAMENNPTSPLTGRQLTDALRDKGLMGKVIIPAFNIRSFESLDGIMQGAKETDSIVIFQIAKSELKYTFEKGYSLDNVREFTNAINEAGKRNNFSNFIIKGDHITVSVVKEDPVIKNEAVQRDLEAFFNQMLIQTKDKNKREKLFIDFYEKNKNDDNLKNVLNAVKEAYELVKSEVDAGMTIFALDASFLPMQLNVLVTAFLHGFIPQETCSIEAEVGEIGGDKNSTPADVLEFLTGTRYAEDENGQLGKDASGKRIIVKEAKGLLNYNIKIDRLALNNGTAHGNNYDKDGNLIETQMNLVMTSTIAELIREYDITIVQHGVTGTPLPNLPKLIDVGITVAHVGTHWQNIIWETLVKFAQEDGEVRRLVVDMVNSLIKKYGAMPKYKVTSNIPESATAEQLNEFLKDKKVNELIGKEIKNLLGQYKPRISALPQEVKKAITETTRRDVIDFFKSFKTDGVAKEIGRAASAIVAKDLENTEVFGRYGLSVQKVEVKQLLGKQNPEEALRDSNARAVLLTSITQALAVHPRVGITGDKATVKKLKEQADSNAVENTILNLIDYTRKNPNIAIAVIADEGGRDESASIPIGRIYWSGYQNGYKDADENNFFESYKSEVLGLRAKGIKVAFFAADALENTNGIVGENAQTKPTSSWSVASLFFDQGIKHPIWDNARVYGIRYNAPTDAGVNYYDLPTVAVEKVVADWAKEKNIAPGSPEFEIFKAEYINNLIILALGAREKNVAKETAQSSDTRHFRIIEDAKELQKKYPGLTIVTPGDGNFAPSVVASLGLNLDGKNMMVIDRSGSAEAKMAYLAAALAPNGQFTHKVVSESKTAKDVNKETAEQFDETIDLPVLRKLGYEEKDYTQQHTKKDFRGSGVLAMTAVTGASPEIFGKTFAGLMSRVQAEANDESVGKGEFRTNTLLVTSGGVFVISTTFDTDDVIASIDKLKNPMAASAMENNPTSPLTGRQLTDALRDKGLMGKVIIPAFNIRSFESLDGIMQGAKETDSIVIFQIAKSELKYTFEKGYSLDNVREFTNAINEAGKRNNFSNFIIKGDHITVSVVKEDPVIKNEAVQRDLEAFFNQMLIQTKDKNKREKLFIDFYEKNKNDDNLKNVLNAVKEAYELVKSEVDAGMTIFALDASFLPMQLNVLVTAFLHGFIPQETCSIEAEVGEIGGDKNSTPADVLEFLTGTRYAEDENGQLGKDASGKRIVVKEAKGLLNYNIKIDRLALNNGTAHGNNYDKDGNLIETQMNLVMTSTIAELIREYGITIVQHGVTGTPLPNLPKLIDVGITVAHVGTHWQNIIWETLVKFAQEDGEVRRLVVDMVNSLIKKYGAMQKYKVTSNIPESATAEQLNEFLKDKKVNELIGKEIKNLLGQYKPRISALPQEVKKAITETTRKDVIDFFKSFKTDGVAKEIGRAAPAVEIMVLANNLSLLEGAQTRGYNVSHAILDEYNGGILNHSEARLNLEVKIENALKSIFSETYNFENDYLALVPTEEMIWKQTLKTEGISDAEYAEYFSFEKDGYLSRPHIGVTNKARHIVNMIINLQLKKVIASTRGDKGYKNVRQVVLCVGETLAQREPARKNIILDEDAVNTLIQEGMINAVIEEDIKDMLKGITKEDAHDIGLRIAYEPRWAIGTGKTPTTDEIQRVHRFIKDTLSQGSVLGIELDVDYGGSLKSKNAKEILHLPDVDGGLIGGAAKTVSEIEPIIKEAIIQGEEKGKILNIGMNWKAETKGTGLASLESFAEFFKNSSLDLSKVTIAIGTPQVGIVKSAIASSAIMAAEKTVVPGQPAKVLGGIDFRQMNMLIQPQGSFASSSLDFSLPALSRAEIEAFDLDKELELIQRMASSGIDPVDERLKKYLAVCFARGKVGKEIDELKLCLEDVFTAQQLDARETPDGYKEVIVIADTRRYVLKESRLAARYGERISLN